MAEELNLHTLKPAQERKDRKRVGRGLGSGKGRYSGRGIKGQKSRAGSKKMPAGFEGGQMPLDMRAPKLRGNTSADAMPIGPFRTYTQGVNVRDLERVFDAGAEVTPESLKAKRLIRTTRIDVKILGQGDLTKKLSVTAHAFSATAREKIEAAGGTVTALRGEKVEKPTKKLAVTAHSFSASAREKITAAGGSATALKEPKETKKKKLSVTAHSFSASAREKITAAGGSATALKEPKERKRKKIKAKSVAEEPEAQDAEAQPTEADEPVAEAETETEVPAEEK